MTARSFGDRVQVGDPEIITSKGKLQCTQSCLK
jgi:hypothetical protein